MSEFLAGLGYLSATTVGAAGVSFGLYAGIKAATWAFGPIEVNVSKGKTVNAPPQKPKECVVECPPNQVCDYCQR